MVVVSSYNTYRKQNNNQNPQNSWWNDWQWQVTNEHEQVMEEMQEIVVRMFERKKRPTILSNLIYSLKHEFYLSVDVNLVSFTQAMVNAKSKKWIDVMKWELKLMNDNNVWDLVEFPNGSKWFGSKSVFKTKWDLKGNIDSYKSRLVTI